MEKLSVQGQQLIGYFGCDVVGDQTCLYEDYFYGPRKYEFSAKLG